MKRQDDGSIVVTIMILMSFLSVLLLSAVVLANANLVRARARILLLQAQYAAESGADMAIAELNDTTNPSASSYAGTGSTQVQVLSNTQYRSTFQTTVSAGSTDKERIIYATGYVYNQGATEPSYTRKIKVVAQRNATSTMSSIVSRNILSISSGVKNITAKDAYISNYVMMAKNTTNFIVENLTVAGKMPTSANCSVYGSGQIVKPPTFSDPTQTKTNITLAYTNCVSPGNVSNSDFNILTNQNNIAPVKSLYLPWSQMMDSTYTAAGSCNDWTTGGTTRNIPSTLGSKQTHYPDSGSGVVSTCGTNGSIDLGSNTYNITDNVHIRASLCAASACDPIFYNPTSTLHYIFVEGTANFDSLRTAQGSGPIALVVYGTLQNTVEGTCAQDKALYLGGGQSLPTYAPAMFLISMNGLCLEKTKFQANGLSATQANGMPTPSLGGVAGKNIYIDTSPGSPWDLGLDPAFPTSQIPLDLSWRQVGYERL